MYKKRRNNFYSDWFKATAVELGALPGVHTQDVAGVLDIHPVMLYRWKKQYRDGEIMKKPAEGSLNSEERSELRRLRKLERAHETLVMEHDLLKKSIQFCSDRKKRSSSS